MLNKSLRAAIILIIGFFLPWSALASWKPTKTISVYVGFGAGGGIDTFARIVTNEISQNTGWNFTVFNKTGGGGGVAMKTLKKEKADGYIIGLTPSEILTFNPQVNPNIGYSYRDFTPLAAITNSQCGLVSLPDSPWNTFRDAVAASKSGQRIAVAYFSAKMGLSMKAINKTLGTDFVLVPVKGGAAGIKNVLGGHVEISWGAGVQGKYVQAGQLKVLASCEKERISMAPDIATVQEMGVPYVSLDAKFVFVGPANMPQDAVKALTREIGNAVKSAKVQDLIANKFQMKAIFESGAVLKKSMDDSAESAEKLISYTK